MLLKLVGLSWILSLHPSLKTEFLKTESKQILYAPTFSPKLTSTYVLLDEIHRLSKEKNWRWLIKFHPKVTSEEVSMYKAIENANLRVVETDFGYTTITKC